MRLSTPWFCLIVLMLFHGLALSPCARLAWAHQEPFLAVTFLGDVRLDRLGPDEPSGVAWGSSKQGKPRLWVVSDDTAKLYILKEKTKKGNFSTVALANTVSLSSNATELEGVTMDASGRAVLVQEETNRVIRLENETFKEVESLTLAEMAGFDRIQEFFAATGGNKGLEGIAWNAAQGTFFLVKEGRPPMLIEIREDLKAILHHWILNEAHGFFIPEFPQDKLDVSGIAYDSHRDVLWLVSDKGKSLFVYDYHRHMVIQRFPLGFSAGQGKGIGTYQRIRKAEGVAISPDGEKLFIVSDKEARLYVYAIRE